MNEEQLESVNISETTLLGDLMNCVMEQVKALPKPWDSMSEDEQTDYIERVEKQVLSAAEQTVNIIASRNMRTITAKVDSVTFKGGVKTVLLMASGAEGVHEIADAEGANVKVVIPDTDDLFHDVGKPEAAPDQRALPMGDEYTDEDDSGEGMGDDFPINTDDQSEPDDLYDAAVALVTESRVASISSVQRSLHIGYNRAARLVEAMEAAGIVSEANQNGVRSVLVEDPGDDSEDHEADDHTDDHDTAA